MIIFSLSWKYCRFSSVLSDLSSRNLENDQSWVTLLYNQWNNIIAAINTPINHSSVFLGVLSIITARMIATPLDLRTRERRDAPESHVADIPAARIPPSHLLSRPWVQLFEEQRWTSSALLRYDFICNVQVIDLRNIVCSIDWLDFSRLFFTRRHREETSNVYRSTLLMISTLSAMAIDHRDGAKEKEEKHSKLDSAATASSITIGW